MLNLPLTFKNSFNVKTRNKHWDLSKKKTMGEEQKKVHQLNDIYCFAIL